MLQIETAGCCGRGVPWGYHRFDLNGGRAMAGQLTKRALEDSLKRLLLQKPLTKITIADLTEDCGVST